MSTFVVWLIAIGVYLVGAVGTARVVFTSNYKREHAWWVKKKATVEQAVKDKRKYGYSLSDREARTNSHDVHYLTVHDSDVWVPTVWSGVLWFLVAPYLLVIRPVGTVVIPMVVKWFTGPARKAVAS